LNIIGCDAQRHSAAILAIFNDAIVNTTALYDYQPRTPESMVTWFEAKTKGRYPVIGVESDEGELMGFASFGPFRAWPAYKYTVEHSVYVDSRFRGQGVGRALLGAVILAAEKQDYHVMVGGIDATNAVSIKLHESLGFKSCGVVRHAGFKFGRWLDLAFYQLILRTPSTPVDG
jgi:L-amino acid N-acyltransferase YncA